MKVAIVRYNGGNTFSVSNSLKRLGINPLISDEVNQLSEADRIIVPGVGEASSAIRYLRHKGLDTFLKQYSKPILGICLGLQLFCKNTEENNTPCFGKFDATVQRFPQTGKIPHIGWNILEHSEVPLFKGIPPKTYVYFVHSYYVPVVAETIAVTEHSVRFSAALHKDNVYALQFHPEKSDRIGSKILSNFLELT